MRVVFMCGPAGSGKSTLARRLESEGMTRLSFDQEAWARGHRRMPLTESDHQAVDAHLRSRLIELVADGVDVVLDFSFWSRRMRDEWRGLLVPCGIEPETIYLATDRQTCLDRVRSRQAEHADDVVLDEATAARYFDQFEVPSPAEGPLVIITEP